MSKPNVFAAQDKTDGWTDEQTKRTDYIDPYVTHMNQTGEKGKEMTSLAL